MWGYWRDKRIYFAGAIISWVAGCPLGWTAEASDSSIILPQSDAVVDLRPAYSHDHLVVVFCFRPPSPVLPHAFLLLGEIDFTHRNKADFAIERGAGYYAKYGKIRAIREVLFGGDTSGYVKDDYQTHQLKELPCAECELAVIIDEEQMALVMAIIEAWSQEDGYHPVTKNCVDFIEEVAFFLEMETPNTFRPKRFIRRLARLNLKKH